MTDAAHTLHPMEPAWLLAQARAMLEKHHTATDEKQARLLLQGSEELATFALHTPGPARLPGMSQDDRALWADTCALRLRQRRHLLHPDAVGLLHRHVDALAAYTAQQAAAARRADRTWEE